MLLASLNIFCGFDHNPFFLSEKSFYCNNFFSWENEFAEKQEIIERTKTTFRYRRLTLGLAKLLSWLYRIKCKVRWDIKITIDFFTSWKVEINFIVILSLSDVLLYDCQLSCFLCLDSEDLKANQSRFNCNF